MLLCLRVFRAFFVYCCYLNFFPFFYAGIVPTRSERVNACIDTSQVVVGPCWSVTVRKGDKHTELPSWFTSTEVYTPLHFFSSRLLERNILWKLSRTRLPDKEKQRVMWKKRAKTDLKISFRFSDVISNVLKKRLKNGTWCLLA